MRLTNIYLIKSKKARICVIWLQMVAIGLSLRRYYQLLWQEVAPGYYQLLYQPAPLVGLPIPFFLASLLISFITFFLRVSL